MGRERGFRSATGLSIVKGVFVRDGQKAMQQRCWRVSCHPFGGRRPLLGEVLIQAVTAEGATIVAPGGGFRLTPEQLRQLADSSEEAAQVQRQQADGRL